jgi:hypothetical protein
MYRNLYDHNFFATAPSTNASRTSEAQSGGAAQ